MREKSNAMKAIAFTLSLLLCVSMLMCSISVYAQDNSAEQTEETVVSTESTEDQNEELVLEGDGETHATINMMERSAAHRPSQRMKSKKVS